MPKTTCRDCNRNVLLVRVGGELVVTDPELITVVAAQDKIRGGDNVPRIVMAQATTYARRLHAEQCSSYLEQARRDRIAGELREFNRQQKGIAPRKNRGL